MSSSPFPSGEESISYLLIDGGSNERRDFYPGGKTTGFVSFTPGEGEAPYYLILVDPAGYERMLEVFEDKAAARRAADFHWHDYGTVLLIDATTTPPTKKIYTVDEIPTVQ